MADFMQMLDQSQRHSAQVLGLASQQILALGAQKVREKEFAASHALAVEAQSEQARMNDAQLIDSAFRNKLLANKYEMDREIQPLRYQEAQMKLESAKVDSRRRIAQEAEIDFNQMTSPFDQIVASNLVANQNPNYAKEVIAYKGNWFNKTKQGEPWDQEQYKKGLIAIDKKYQGVGPISDKYNPEVSYLLGQFGAKKQQARYEASNPIFSGSITGIKSSMITGSEADFQGAVAHAGSLISEKDITALALGRRAYQSAGNQIKINNDRLDKLNSQIAIAGNDPKDRKSQYYHDLVDQRNLLSEDQKELMLNQRAIHYNLVTGEPLVIDTPAPAPAPDDPQNTSSNAAKNAKDIASSLERSPLTSDIDTSTILSQDKRSTAATRIKKLEEVNRSFKTKNTNGVINPLEGIQLGAYVVKPSNESFLSNYNESVIDIPKLKGQIRKNIESVDTGDLPSLLDTDGVKELFNKLGKKRIEVASRFDAKSFIIQGKDAGIFNGIIAGGNTTSTKKIFGIETGYRNKYVIDSYESLQRAIKGSDLSEAGERINFIDIYSALVAAAAENTLH